MLNGRHSISNALVMACIAALVAAYMPPHGRGLGTDSLSVSSVRLVGVSVPLGNYGANSDEHPLFACDHMRKNGPIYSENRKDIRVKGSLYLIQWQFQRGPLEDIY